MNANESASPSWPQPLGVLPLPAGWLLLPAEVLATEDGGACRDLLVGGQLPPQWPAALEFYRLAADGDLAGAAATQSGYNHYVLTGEPSSRQQAMAAGDPVLGVLTEVAAYALGDAERPPVTAAVLAAQPGLPPEVVAHLCTAEAAWAMEHHDLGQALTLIEQGIAAADGPAPTVTGLLRGQRAGLLQELGRSRAEVIAEYLAAVEILRNRPAPGAVIGDLAEALGSLLQEEHGPTALTDAVQNYHLALRHLRREDHPERFAAIHLNLALAYLSMPMAHVRDRLRRGIAVQSLREALQIYLPEHYPRQWAAATLNLANALQYLPSAHPVENLVEAVELYDTLLAHDAVQHDRGARARVLANQGTALAHLGIHDQAEAKWVAAEEDFRLLGDTDAIATVEQARKDSQAMRDGSAAPASGEG